MACATQDLRKPWSALDPEAVANAFAADLLLPEYLVRPRVDGRPISFTSVAEVEDAFQVSRSAAALRLVEFGSYDAMLLCHDKDGNRE
jgi:Zn-dependent peptidase ImmA (M78 family)